MNAREVNSHRRRNDYFYYNEKRSNITPWGNAMSAFGPKRTSLVASHMSAFGGEADMFSTAYVCF